MKEVSIEEKAKRYDEALKQIKECTPDENGFVTIYPQEIFPELKESEDEKLRKRLIQIFKSYQNSKTHINPNKWEGLKICDILAWFEKQGKIVEYYEDKLDRCACYNFNKGYKAAMEKQGEQKAVKYDKVEPKFKVGDWVTNSIETVQITGYDIDYGYQVDYKGNLQHRDTDIIEKEYHLWTIQDAKDGDVLAAHECYVIFKEIDGLNIKCYCTYHYLNQQAFYVDTLQNKTAFHPATKEQRDQLEKAMADAGYKWNPDEKKSEEIEENPAWSEEDEKMLQSVLWHVSNSVSNGKSQDIRCDLTEWLKSIKDRCQPKLQEWDYYWE